MSYFKAQLERALTILERRRSEGYSFFHGTPSYEIVAGILNHGTSVPTYWSIQPGRAASYALYHPSAQMSHKGQIPCIIEAVLNLHNQQVRGDEDVAIRPYHSEIKGGMSRYDKIDTDEEWEEWFKAILPDLPDDKKEEVKQQMLTKNDLSKRFAKHVPVQKNAVRRGDETTLTSVATQQPIGLKGRNRIIGAYIISEENAATSLATKDSAITIHKVVYDNGGTLREGQRIPTLPWVSFRHGEQFIVPDVV